MNPVQSAVDHRDRDVAVLEAARNRGRGAFTSPPPSGSTTGRPGDACGRGHPLRPSPPATSTRPGSRGRDVCPDYPDLYGGPSTVCVTGSRSVRACGGSGGTVAFLQYAGPRRSAPASTATEPPRSVHRLRAKTSRPHTCLRSGAGRRRTAPTTSRDRGRSRCSKSREASASSSASASGSTSSPSGRATSLAARCAPTRRREELGWAATVDFDGRPARYGRVVLRKVGPPARQRRRATPRRQR